MADLLKMEKELNFNTQFKIDLLKYKPEKEFKEITSHLKNILLQDNCSEKVKLLKYLKGKHQKELMINV